LRFDVFKSSRTRLSARLTAQGPPLEHKNGGLAPVVTGKTGHAGAAEHDRLALSSARARSTSRSMKRRAPEVRTRKRQHWRVGGAHADEACA
jgi:hypothetical protein